MVMVLRRAADIPGVELLAAKHDRRVVTILGNAANVLQCLYLLPLLDFSVLLTIY